MIEITLWSVKYRLLHCDLFRTFTSAASVPHVIMSWVTAVTVATFWVVFLSVGGLWLVMLTNQI